MSKPIIDAVPLPKYIWRFPFSCIGTIFRYARFERVWPGYLWLSDVAGATLNRSLPGDGGLAQRALFRIFTISQSKIEIVQTGYLADS